ncbi:MAG TPA: YceI family protein [Bacteroidia bacterium]|nr:YceI family protein [Bacteroidia bacterium]
MKMTRSVSLLLLFILQCLHSASQNRNATLKSNDGEIVFLSDAPMELITAKSKKLQSVINSSERTFAFVVNIKSFEGFNAALQRDHFNENYMESSKFPVANFSGKIIEDYDLSIPGLYSVRAKGILNIHGVPQERIVKAVIKVTEDGIEIYSKFSVMLKEHAIKVPRVVHEKISTEVDVTVSAKLK